MADQHEEDHGAGAAAAGSIHDLSQARRNNNSTAPPTSWTTKAFQVLTAMSGTTTLACAFRLWNYEQRMSSLSHARSIEVDQLDSFFQAQQSQQPDFNTSRLEYKSLIDSTQCAYTISRVHVHLLLEMSDASSPYPGSTSILPPQYLSISGRSTCSNPIQTQFTPTPQPAVWYSKLETKYFLKLFPFTRWKMIDEQRSTAYFEAREFELVPTKPKVGTNSTITAGSSVASNLTASSHPSSSSIASAVLSSVVPSAASIPTVSIPSSLPADPRYFRSLLREVSDTIRDVSMSSSSFMQQMSEGRLQVKERNVEHIVPTNQPLTVIGWVHRDPHTGHISVLQGQTNQTPAAMNDMSATGTLARGVTPKMLHPEPIATTPSTNTLDSSQVSHHQPDLQAYSYSTYDHPCIITSKSHARIMEDERASVSSARRYFWISLGITTVIVVFFAGRYFYKSYLKQQELQRLMEFHASRKERRELKLREQKEKAKRRAAKQKQAEHEKELQQLKHAQVAYFNATQAAVALTQAAAAAQAANNNNLHQMEGVPHPSHYSGPASSPRPLRQANSPAPMSQSASQTYMYPIPTGTSTSSTSYVSRAASPFPALPPRPISTNNLPSMTTRVPSPFTMTDVSGISLPMDPTTMRRQPSNGTITPATIMQPSSSSSSQTSTSSTSSTSVYHSSSSDEVDGSGSSDGVASDDEASGSCEDGSESGEDHADYCIICAETKADACMLPCAHLYTCTFCASKITVCPICRTKIEKVVKVYAQQL